MEYYKETGLNEVLLFNCDVRKIGMKSVFIYFIFVTNYLDDRYLGKLFALQDGRPRDVHSGRRRKAHRRRSGQLFSYPELGKISLSEIFPIEPSVFQIISVVHVSSQGGEEMKLKDFIKYYKLVFLFNFPFPF